MRLPRPRRPRPERWLSENPRSMVAVAAAVVATVPGGFGIRRYTGEPTASADIIVLVMTVYFAVYVAVTASVHRSCTQDQVRVWARRQGRGNWYRRYVTGTAPGPGLPISVGALALVTGVVWIPRGDLLGSTLPVGLRIGLGVALIVVAWATMNLVFAVAYRAEDLLGDRPVLELPGDLASVWSDYVYFATSMSTSFGSNDVVVVDIAARRTVAVHSVVAFVYNTVILGAVVSTVVTL